MDKQEYIEVWSTLQFVFSPAPGFITEAGVERGELSQGL